MSLYWLCSFSIMYKRTAPRTTKSWLFSSGVVSSSSLLIPASLFLLGGLNVLVSDILPLALQSCQLAGTRGSPSGCVLSWQTGENTYTTVQVVPDLVHAVVVGTTLCVSIPASAKPRRTRIPSAGVSVVVATHISKTKAEPKTRPSICQLRRKKVLFRL